MSDKKRILKGKVVSDKGDKTIVIEVKSRKTHPLYSKQYTVTKKYHAHDEDNTAHTDDTVEIIECVPVSKTKKWKLHNVVETRKEVSK